MITRDATKQLQGLAILSMLCLHLFCTLDPQFVPLIQLADGVPLAYFFGQAADFCVMAYCFCSGYGLMASYHQAYADKRAYLKGRLPSVRQLLYTYWLVLALFACVALALGKGGAWLQSPQVFLGNAAVFGYSYNGAWWFLSTYLLMLLLSPWVFAALEAHPRLVAAGALLLYIAAYRLRFSQDGLLLGHIARLGMSYPELLIGAYFYKYHAMDWIRTQWCRIIPERLRIPLLVAAAAAIIVVRRYVPTLFLAPISGLAFLVIYLLLRTHSPALQSLLGYFGAHSTNIWLVHMFFYLPHYGGLAYYAKYDVLVFAALLGMSLCASYLIMFLKKLGCREFRPIRANK